MQLKIVITKIAILTVILTTALTQGEAGGSAGQQGDGLRGAADDAYRHGLLLRVCGSEGPARPGEISPGTAPPVLTLLPQS